MEGKGDPQLLGVPIFVVGAIALGLTLVRYVPAAAGGAALPILMAATGLGLLVATVWAARNGESYVASVFGIFLGFWWSFPVLVLGLNHDWFKIPADDIKKSVALFLISWTILIFFLMISSVRLPSIYTLLFFLVVVALIVETIATLNESEGLHKFAGVVVFAFAAVGVYIFMAVASLSLGGRGLPLGKPLARTQE